MSETILRASSRLRRFIALTHRLFLEVDIRERLAGGVLDHEVSDNSRMRQGREKRRVGGSRSGMETLERVKGPEKLGETQGLSIAEDGETLSDQRQEGVAANCKTLVNCCPFPAETTRSRAPHRPSSALQCRALVPAR
jgi:hypothetical protein